MGSRIRDLVIIFSVVALGAYLRQKPSEAPVATPTPVAAATQTSGGFPDKAPPFELPSNQGTTSFNGKGPLVVVLTAVGCGDCIQRIPRDEEIYEMARKAHVPYYNALVYVEDVAAGERFVKEHRPAADLVLYDPGGKVFVGQYLGSDNNCLMVIGRNGEFLYRGPENKEAMQKAIASL